MPGELTDLINVERREVNTPGPSGRCAGECLADRSGPEIRATGDDDSEVGGLVSDEIGEEVECDGVRPVKILEDKDRGGQVLDQLCRSAEDLMPGLTLIRRPLGWGRETIGDLRQEGSQAADDRTESTGFDEVGVMVKPVTVETAVRVTVPVRMAPPGLTERSVTRLLTAILPE